MGGVIMKVYEMAIKVNEKEYDDIVFWIQTPHEIFLAVNHEKEILYLKEISVTLGMPGIDIIVK